MKKKLLGGGVVLLMITLSFLNVDLNRDEEGNTVTNLVTLNSQALADTEICVGQVCYYKPNDWCVSYYWNCPDEPPEYIDDYYN